MYVCAFGTFENTGYLKKMDNKGLSPINSYKTPLWYKC